MTLMHSHHNIDMIFHHLWQLTERGSFVDLVFRCVMFHQSLDGVARFPPMVALSDSERGKFCDPDFYKLMGPLMIADSESYTYG